MRATLLLSLLVLSLLCVTRNAHAQIHRCIGARGEPVFTDQPCGSSELAVGVSSSAAATDIATDHRNIATSPGAPLIASCPRSPQQVSDRIAIAFNDNNTNALAGLFDWRGFSHTSANARLKEFSRWLKYPLVGVQFSGAVDPSGAQPGDADYTSSSPTGVTVLTQSGAADGETPNTRSFGLTQRGGCWWLTFSFPQAGWREQRDNARG